MKMSCLSARQHGLCPPPRSWLRQRQWLLPLPTAPALLEFPHPWPLTAFPGDVRGGSAFGRQVSGSPLRGIWGCLKSTASSSLLQGVDLGAVQRSEMLRDTVQWRGTARCGSELYGAMQCTTLQCHMMQCSVPGCSVVRCHAVQHDAVQCSTAWCCMTQCHAV